MRIILPKELERSRQPCHGYYIPQGSRGAPSTLLWESYSSRNKGGPCKSVRGITLPNQAIPVFAPEGFIYLRITKQARHESQKTKKNQNQKPPKKEAKQREEEKELACVLIPSLTELLVSSKKKKIGTVTK